MTYLFGVSILATFVAAIAAFIFGFLWHSQAGFANYWMKLQGIDPKKMKKQSMEGMTPTFILALVANLVLAWALGYFLFISGLGGAWSGVCIAFIAWLGFVATQTLNGVLWEKKSWALWRFNNAYLLLQFVLMGAIMGAFA